MGKKVIVLGEIRDGELRNVTFEAIAAGRTISGDGKSSVFSSVKMYKALHKSLFITEQIKFLPLRTRS